MATVTRIDVRGTTADSAALDALRSAAPQDCEVLSDAASFEGLHWAFKGLCWADPKTTFSLNQTEPGTLTGRGFNKHGEFTVSGTWNEDNTVSITCSNQNGEFPMDLKWDDAACALAGTAAGNEGSVLFSLEGQGDRG
jgi:hypothetical protein